jgi:uncharacterized protein (TIGR02996 family)
MPELNETAFLRSIAENDDDAGRLMLADWLEENGDQPRADFLRVQCELLSSGMSEDRRRTLRVRERQLLDAHRQEWVRSFGLPLEDVSFQGGLIAGARLSQWQDGRLLDTEHAPWLATLRELDLSSLGIGDAGLKMFAEEARFPALRKLILSDNGITDDGLSALARAAGLPRLETVYLSQNSLGNGARSILERVAHFHLKDLDLGERVEGYCMSPGETDVARRRYVRASLLPAVSRYFETHTLLRSAMLCVAQYWDDEASDAVHRELVVSELIEPTLEEVTRYESGSDPNVPNTHIESEFGDLGSLVDFGSDTWNNNHDAIPLWAAFASEGGTQNYEHLSDVYLPAVMFYRHGGYEILPMCRPHLDGIRPTWGSEE